MTYLIYTDGGSRGNPGPAAAGFVVDGVSYGRYVGETTNNVAEYSAIKFALEKALELLGEKASETLIEMHMDSQLAQRQLIGRYKVKNAGLKPIFLEIQRLAEKFKKVSFIHIPREENAAADAAVNKVLDAR